MRERPEIVQLIPKAMEERGWTEEQLLKKVYEHSLKHSTRYKRSYPTTLPTAVYRSVELFHKGESGKGWDQRAHEALEGVFGEDADLLCRLLAATSPGSDPDLNLKWALSAYRLYKSGLPLGDLGHRWTKTVLPNVQRAIENKPLSGLKVWNFARSLMGHKDAVTVDMWIARIILGKPSVANDGEYLFCEQIIREVAQALQKPPVDVTAEDFKKPQAQPVLDDYRDIQARVWVGINPNPKTYDESLAYRLHEQTREHPEFDWSKHTKMMPPEPENRPYQKKPVHATEYAVVVGAPEGQTKPYPLTVAMPRPEAEEILRKKRETLGDSEQSYHNLAIEPVPDPEKKKTAALPLKTIDVLTSKLPQRIPVEQLSKFLDSQKIPRADRQWLGIDDYIAEHQGEVVEKPAFLSLLESNFSDFEEGEGEGKYEEFSLPGENYREKLYKLKHKETYESPHWMGEENVMFHTRLIDTTTPDGGRVLLMNETQSDWHGTGRDEGYREESTETYKPPKGPFQESWQEVAIYKALKDAIAGGYDYLAWPTGKQLSSMFEQQLLSHIDQLDWKKDGTGNVMLVGKKRRQVLAQMSAPLVGAVKFRGVDVTLNRLIGKQLAELIRRSTDAQGTIMGTDFPSVESGMAAFYDVGGGSSQNIASYAQKVLRPFGREVEQLRLSSGEEVWGIEITPELKNYVESGKMQLRMSSIREASGYDTSVWPSAFAITSDGEVLEVPKGRYHQDLMEELIMEQKLEGQAARDEKNKFIDEWVCARWADWGDTWCWSLYKVGTGRKSVTDVTSAQRHKCIEFLEFSVKSGFGKHEFSVELPHFDAWDSNVFKALGLFEKKKINPSGDNYVSPYAQYRGSVGRKPMLRIAIIKKKDGKYYVKSEKGKNLGGPYNTKSEAVERLRQVEYFKHKKESSMMGLQTDLDRELAQALDLYEHTKDVMRKRNISIFEEDSTPVTLTEDGEVALPNNLYIQVGLDQTLSLFRVNDLGDDLEVEFLYPENPASDPCTNPVEIVPHVKEILGLL